MPLRPPSRHSYGSDHVLPVGRPPLGAGGDRLGPGRTKGLWWKDSSKDTRTPRRIHSRLSILDLQSEEQTQCGVRTGAEGNSAGKLYRGLEQGAAPKDHSEAIKKLSYFSYLH